MGALLCCAKDQSMYDEPPTAPAYHSTIEQVIMEAQPNDFLPNADIVEL